MVAAGHEAVHKVGIVVLVDLQQPLVVLVRHVLQRLGALDEQMRAAHLVDNKILL